MSNPPANTEQRFNTVRSASSSSSYDHCTAWRSVWWRSSPRRDPTSSRNRLSRRSRISVTDIESSREAANSIASGIPSSRWQISTTASSSSTGETPRATAHARSTNSEAAAESGPVRTSRGGTGQSNSSLIRNPSRLVARILTVSERAKIELDHVGSRVQHVFAVVEHQQPHDAPSNAAATLSATLSPACWVMPRTAATDSGTAAGSLTAASSMTHTPSGKLPAERAADSSASRVLPTPPTPVNVTNRCAFSAVSRSASSASRPTKLVVGRRRFPGVASSGLQWWKIGCAGRRRCT